MKKRSTITPDSIITIIYTIIMVVIVSEGINCESNDYGSID